MIEPAEEPRLATNDASASIVGNRSARAAVLGPRLQYPFAGHAQVEVLFERGVDEVSQHLVVEKFRPPLIADRRPVRTLCGELRIGAAVGGGNLHDRTLVVRPHGARRSRQHYGGKENARSHWPTPETGSGEPDNSDEPRRRSLNDWITT